MKNLIFGTRQIGGPPSYNKCDENKALHLLDYVYNNGINTFDNAPIYGNGKSEELLGKFIVKNNIRKNCKIITKFGIRFYDDGKNYFNYSYKSIYEEIYQSLERLKTDYIDIYLLHIPNGYIEQEEVIYTLNELKTKGLIKSYGLCNSYGDFLKGFLDVKDNQIEYIEDFYNIIEKKAEKLIFPYLDLKKHKFLAYGPFYRGLLFNNTDLKGLLNKNEKAIDRLFKNNSLPQIIKQRKILEIIAERNSKKIEELAFNFLNDNKFVDSILFGTKDIEHIKYFLDLIKK